MNGLDPTDPATLSQAVLALICLAWIWLNLRKQP